ncbi:MAG: signal peptide peptidase SppA [Pseudomonadales bacterium]|nr:signal peptide peptidase SppA [Pseudomonadales bacterium]
MTQPKAGVWTQLARGISRVRNFFANSLFVLLMLFVLLALFARGGIPVPQDAALILNPQGVIVDQPSIRDPIAQFFAMDGVTGEVPLTSLTLAIEKAAADERIKLLVLDLDELAGVATTHAESIGEAIRGFQSTGKRVLAYGRFFSQAQYQIASYADALYLHPMGQLLLQGFGINQLYISELLEKLDVNVHVFRVGKYKEFVEPYTRTGMSDEARTANQTMIDSLWRQYGDRVIGNRKIDRTRFEAYTQAFPDALARYGDMATVALEHDLVDELLTPDAIEARIADQVGVNAAGDLNAIGFKDYLAAIDGEPGVAGSPSIAVVTAQGPIIVGRRARGVIASDSLIELIRAARKDDDVAALVLRLDSPGGSAFASEMIRQELELTQLAGKPVVVSMSSVAASGGYWIASTADRILAQPATITGSIGVFGLFTSFERSLDQIGVRTDGVGTTPLSRALDPFSGVSSDMSRILQLNVEETYSQFLNLVARGRDLSPEAVDAIAQGRVWTGGQAHDLGLVDDLGDLDDAIAQAAGLAALESYGVRYLSTPMSARELLLAQLGESIELPAHPLVQRLRAGWDLIDSLNDPASSYALCEPCLSAGGLLR